MSGVPDVPGELAGAIDETMALLASQPRRAAERALGILKQSPGEPHATLLLGMARRQLGDLVGSVEALISLVRGYPEWAQPHYELGATLVAARRPQDAFASLLRAVRLQADIGEAWRLLGATLLELGDPNSADRAYANHLAVSTGNPELLPAATALCEQRLADAEALLQAYLALHPDDTGALIMLSEVMVRSERLEQAEQLLSRCLELAPDNAKARRFLAIALYKQARMAACLAQFDILLAAEPHNAAYLTMRANALGATGDVDQALELFARVLADYPPNARIWLAYGNVLKTAGRVADSIRAYRRAIELAPSLGETYWSLANLKTFHFSSADVAAMRAQLARTDLPNADRIQFEFALGKALEDAAQYAESFAHYAEGNRRRLAGAPYDANDTTEFVNGSKSLFTVEFFRQRRGCGCPSPDPIFVVGLPRSGSTLVEQILASHSAVEGTMELPDLLDIVRQLTDSQSNPGMAGYAEVLAALSPDALRELGERYLASTRVQRKTGKPFFIDKNPNNFGHVGLIQLILPNARIIDARRHPMACCFSCFKQHFARGQSFTYSLEDVGRYYRDYVDLMDHFDAVLPGRVHRVIYERMVEDTENEVRRLLDYCGLPFEEACLRFYETERAVSTPSAQQVRRPIFREGMDQWRHYAPWLGPLEAALGPALATWNGAP